MACVSNTSFAVWQSGTATVQLNGADVENVRVMAIKNAIADASFQNGSIIAAEDVVLDGLLVSSKSVITSQGRIQRVEILSEIASEDALKVVVRVDISPLFSCQQDPYSRSILITQFQLLKPQQASNGGIFDLGKQISKRFVDQLRGEPIAPQVLLINKALNDFRSNKEVNAKDIREKSLYMAREYGRQFILFGFIRDISLFEQVKEKLLADEVSLRRNFTIEVYLLDAFRQNILFQESYHSEANWDFSNDYSVDTNNSLFWRSNYGRVVLNTISGAVSDISNMLECEKNYAQVIDNTEQQLTINIGTEHGVKIGDKFNLYKNNLVIGSNGWVNSMITSSQNSTLNVILVDSETSVLTSEELGLINSADLFDLVSPIP